MTASLLVARAQWRVRWRSLLAIALVAGTAGAVSLGAWRAAERAGTSFERLLAGSKVSNVSVPSQRPIDKRIVQRIAQLPGVQAASRFSILVVAPDRSGARIGKDVIGVASTLRVGGGTEFPVVSGRAADPARPEEILVNEEARDRFDLHVGDQVPLASLTPDQMAGVDQGHNSGPPAGPTVPVVVVGVFRGPNDISDTPESDLALTPAFYDRYAARIAHLDTAAAYVDRDHIASVRAGGLDAALTQILGPLPDSPSVDDYEARTTSALDVQVLGLRLFAVVSAAAGLIAVVAMVGRHRSADSPLSARRAALGMTAADDRAAAAFEFWPVAMLAAALTVAAAVLAAPLAVTGLAARAEPDPGVWWDPVSLPAGAAIVIGSVVLLAVFGARPQSSRRSPRPGGRSALSLGGPGGPARRYGIRLLLPFIAVPRVNGLLALSSVASGVAAVLAAAGFAASSSHLLSTPAAYGRTYDFSMTPASVPAGEQRQWAVQAAGQVPAAVAAAVAVSQWGPLVLSGPRGSVGLVAETVEPVRGELSPVLRAGRAPAAEDEIALGQSSQHALGVAVGDRVTVPGTRRSLRVVGSYVVSYWDDTSDGALLTPEGFRAAIGLETHANVWLRLRPQSDASQAEQLLAGISASAGPDRVPSNVNNLRQLGRVPVALATFLALLAVVAAGNVMASTARRRRVEFALLRALGFRRGQVRSAVRWLGLSTALAGVVAGAPLGVLVGRRLWAVMAASLGVVDEPVLNWPVVGLSVPATVLAGLLLAVPIGLSVGRTPPARWLRAE